MKKVIMASICVVIIIAVIGTSAINYVFDRMIGKGLMSQIGITDHLLENSGINTTEDRAQENGQANGADEKENSAEKAETKESQKNEENFTIDRLKEVEAQFSTLDKAKIIRLLTSKFSMEELRNLAALASSGVSGKELQEVKVLLKEKMNSEEIAYLKELYEKYY